MRRLGLCALALFAACVPVREHVELGVPDVEMGIQGLGLPSSDRSIRVVEPVDARPRSEIEGEIPATVSVVLVPLGVAIAIQHNAKGSFVTRSSSFKMTAHIQSALEAHIHSTGLFRAATGEGADYVLESEVLHLVGASYRTMVTTHIIGLHSGGSQTSVSRAFLPHATAALRLRLKDGQGKTIGERVVTSSVIGQPTVIEKQPITRIEKSQPLETDGLKELANAALRGCLCRARVLVASWVREHETQNLSVEFEEVERNHASHRFLIHAVDGDRTGVTFALVECPSGRILSVHSVDGVPLVGRPGEWIVSPMAENGVTFPTAYYDALTRHLSRRFLLRRVDEIAAFHYFGLRTGATRER
jgi:hypothetical protein